MGWDGLGTRGMGWVPEVWVGQQGYGVGTRGMGWVPGVWGGYQGYGMGTRGMGWVPGVCDGYGMGTRGMGWVPGVATGVWDGMIHEDGSQRRTAYEYFFMASLNSTSSSTSYESYFSTPVNACKTFVGCIGVNTTSHAQCTQAQLNHAYGEFAPRVD